MENFTTELTPGNTKAAMRDAGASSVDLYMMAPSELHELEGFNVRVVNDKYKARIRWIADSIKENGYFKDKPIAAFVAIEDGVNKVYVTDGYTRLAGVNLAISEGYDLPSIPVVIKPRGTSMEDLTVNLVMANEGNALSAYEQAIVCQRLSAMNLTQPAIAKRLGFASVTHVSNLLLLAGAPSNVRQLVMDEKVSATTAIQALSTYGDKAYGVLNTALNKAEPGTKVTPKHLPNHAFNKVIKKQAPVYFTALTKIKEDPAYGQINPELKSAIESLIAEATLAHNESNSGGA